MRVSLEERNGEIGKECAQCRTWKPLDRFHNASKGLGKRVSKCKDCRNTGFKWNKKSIVNELLKLKENDFDFSFRNFKKHHGGLLKACIREYGNYKNALNESGIEYKENNKYTDETLLNHLMEYIKNNDSAVGYSQNYNSEYKSIVNRFGSFRKALEKIQKEYTWFVNWSEETVIDALIKSSEHGIISRKDISEVLYYASCRVFGDFITATDRANIKYDRVIFENWTKENVISEIRNLNTLSYCVVESENQGLVGAARRYFGSWKNAIQEAGFSYEEIREDKRTTNYCGRKFEDLTDSLLSELNIQFSKYQHERWNPDYVFKNHTWGDAKLSEWTSKNDTILNYEPCCRMLTIIFMRGNKNKDEMITGKTRMISVYKLIKQLPKEKRKLYTSKIQEIEKDLLIIENNQITA